MFQVSFSTFSVCELHSTRDPISDLFLSVVGVIAAYTGIILWRLFIRLDSPRYPLKTYADIAERIFGKPARHVAIVLQSVQLIVVVRF